MDKIAWFLLALTVAGCAPTTTIRLDNGEDKQAVSSYVRDETGSDNYPSFVAGEGNIYGCRYGIHAYARSEFDPPKQEMFAKLVAKEHPSIVSHDVRLKRFDVYRNYRARLVQNVGNSMGGVIVPGEAKKMEAQHSPTAISEPFSFQQVQGNGRGDATENQIGCDGAGEGEYFPSLVEPHNDVIVIWLRFTVDGVPYSFRSMLQFGYVSLAANDRAVEYAIHETMRMAGKKIAD
jgi:hypothetical protein